MIKIVKFALLTATAAIALNSNQAQATSYNGDLIIGFTKQSGNDFIYDLGAASSLTNGQTWDLHTGLTGYTLTTVNWGVIGDTNFSSTRYAYTTTDGTIPNSVPNASAWGKLNTATTAIYQNMPAAGTGQNFTIAVSDDNSWVNQTINGNLPTSYVNVYGNPNVVGLVSDSYYGMIANNSPPQLAGKFTLAANGVVTFNTVANTPPAPTIVLVTRVGTITTIFFTTTNTYTYSLYFTNSSGLGAALTSWPKSATTVAGPGGGMGATNSIADSTTDDVRFYRVGAQ